MSVDIARLSNLFNFKSFLPMASSYTGSKDFCWHVYTYMQALLETTEADNDCSVFILGGAFPMIGKSI